MKVDLLKGKIGRTFFLLFISAIGSTIVQTVYSTVDMICVGHYVGAIGTSAISCMNPMWALIFAPGALTGVGGAVMSANRKGSGNHRAANEYFTVASSLCLVFSVIIMLALILFPSELLIFFGANDPEVLSLALEYTKYVAISSPTFTMCACLATYMRNDGEAIVPTVATVIGGVTNMLLDVLLVFDFGAGMGIGGAGLATATGQTVAFIIILSYYFTKKCSLKLVKPTKTLRKLYRIFSLGFSAFALEMAFCVTTTVFNNIIVESLTYDHLAVYGTAATVAVFFYSLLNGAGTAMQPIAAQNYGAGSYRRVASSLKVALVTATALAVFCFALVEIFPTTVLRIYMDVNDTILRDGPSIMRIYLIAMPFIGVTLVSSFYFQAVLKQWMCMTIALLRGLVLPILLALTLPKLFSIGAIWWCMPLTELITFLVTVVFLILNRRELRRAEAAEGATVEQAFA